MQMISCLLGPWYIKCCHWGQSDFLLKCKQFQLAVFDPSYLRFLFRLADIPMLAHIRSFTSTEQRHGQVRQRAWNSSNCSPKNPQFRKREKTSIKKSQSTRKRSRKKTTKAEIKEMGNLPAIQSGETKFSWSLFHLMGDFVFYEFLRIVSKYNFNWL